MSNLHRAAHGRTLPVIPPGQEWPNWLDRLNGWLGPDTYSTAWVALVPDADDPSRPAWPEALSYLRTNQLEDGGWGEPSIYYAHERTISALAAILALHVWGSGPGDAARIRSGLAAVRQYADDLPIESHEPIGFELLLPRLRTYLSPVYGAELPLDQWDHIDSLNGEKLALIESLHPESARPQPWWFSMEMLPEEQLAMLDDSFLEFDGSMSTSTAATAAYLCARRRAGQDSALAASYLAQAVEFGKGGVTLCKGEVFERAWAYDGLLRAGFDPQTPAFAPLIESIRASWNLHSPGLGYSDSFRINDGDCTALGFTALNGAGLLPSDEPLLAFWGEDHFRTYLDERGASVSANIHALLALRSQPGFPHRDLAERLTGWLQTQMDPKVVFVDKWHLSPYYPVGRAIHAFAGWNHDITTRCLTFILDTQRPDGGWSWSDHSTLEETAYCVIGLCHAFDEGMLPDASCLTRAARFFQANADQKPVERLWIGKALYRPEGLLEVTIQTARLVLENMGITGREEEGSLAA